MTDKPPLLVHIGYHKTGTTWLQRVLFQPEFGYHPLLGHEEIFEHIIKPHDMHYRPEKPQAMIAGLRSAHEDGSIDVISSEMLSGNPFYGSRENLGIARRLAGIVPDARILITIRNQMSILPSVYMQYLSRGGSMTMRQFFAEKPVMGYSTFTAETFEYHLLLQVYRDLFGEDRVLVLTQEQLNSDMNGYLNTLAAFSGNNKFSKAGAINTDRVGVSFPESFITPIRLVNFLRSGPTGPESLIGQTVLGQKLYHATGRVARSFPFAKLAETHRPVSRYVREKFEGRFSDSNQVLRDMLPDQAEWLKKFK